MRKLLTSSVMFMLLSMFSGVVFAGKIAVCEEIKHDPAYKGLYGLCNAYWNADENAQDRILERFYEKAGPEGPGMPGLDEMVETPVCPCWPAGQIDNGVTPDLGFCWVSSTYVYATYDFNEVGFILGEDGPASCRFYDYGAVKFITRPDGDNPAPTPEEMQVCVDELLAQVATDFGEDCTYY